MRRIRLGYRTPFLLFWLTGQLAIDVNANIPAKARKLQPGRQLAGDYGPIEGANLGRMFSSFLSGFNPRNQGSEDVMEGLAVHGAQAFTPYDDCFMDDVNFSGEPRLSLRTNSILRCQKFCSDSSFCLYFAYSTSPPVCYLHENWTPIMKIKNVKIGPKKCTDSYAGLKEAESVRSAAIPAGAAAVGQASLGQNVAGGMDLVTGFPLNELVETGMNLYQSGFFRARGIPAFSGPGVGIDKELLAPPPGIPPPSVICQTQGMSCCVPQESVKKKSKRKPPSVNGIEKPECQANYKTTTGEFCSTIRFDHNHCDIELIETQDVTVWRALMMMPDRAMNDAVCECTLNKTNPADIKRNAQWKFSMMAAAAAAESAQQKVAKFESKAERVADAADTAIAWGQIFRDMGAQTRNALRGPGGVGSMYQI